MIDLDENVTPEKIVADAMVNAGAPLMHSRVEEAVVAALREAGMLVKQPKQVCAWCPSLARGSAHHNDGKLHPSCGQIDHGQSWVPDYPVERIGVIEAERDAALAAIERVRAIHVEREHRTLDGAYLGGAVCDGCRRPWPCPTAAALDGAPEPEEKP